jgi:hypothetical protein
MKIVHVAEGAVSVPSYSEQTITRNYDTSTTLQSFGYGDAASENDSQRNSKPSGVREPA